ncbi:MAG TPA: transcriptional regulator [Verrucomicrobiales bacterium]|nr:transcriptional regulator [Verrucomicrobiales bacterium]
MPAKPTKSKSSGSKNSKPQMSANVAAILGLGTTTGRSKGKARGKTSGTPNGSPKIKPEWMKYYNILLELRERLRNQMAGLAKESAEQLAGYSLHMADSGTDNFDRDFALSLLSSDQDAVYEIEEALKRIERQTFGVCELTGKSIPKARLDAIPWTRFTVEAQMQLEKDGALRSRRLGSLGTVDSAGGIEIEDDSDDEKPVKESKD